MIGGGEQRAMKNAAYRLILRGWYSILFNPRG